MMRKKIVAGNWKMNKTFTEAEELITGIAEALDDTKRLDSLVVLCPPSPYLELATDLAQDSVFKVGAQNVYPQDFGAYTGEISPVMLKALEVDYCIVGHSERRKYFHESNRFLSEKVDALLKQEITPIFCCGELLPDREASRHFAVVEEQIFESLFHLDGDAFRKLVVAYEPVWAIGTGVNASPGQAEEMHAFIRNLIRAKYGEEVAAEISLLYGGSCNSRNARELFSQADVDGGLIGGASLHADEFIQIVCSF